MELYFQDRRHGERVTTVTAPVRTGETFEVEIDNLGYRGEGVGRHDGFTVFVSGALPGERVRVRAGRVARSHAFAHLLDVVCTSPDRVAAPCPVFGACGGCQLQHISYDGQLAFKRRQLVDALTRIGRFDSAVVERVVAPARGMDDPWRYRNKVSVVAMAREGRFVAGFMEEGTHDPVGVDECLIRPEAHDRTLGVLLDLVRDLGIAPYEERTDTGHVRQIVVRTSSAGDALVVIEARGAGQVGRNRFSETAGGANDADAAHGVRRGENAGRRSRGGVNRIGHSGHPNGGLPHGQELARRLSGRMPAGFRLAGVVAREFTPFTPPQAGAGGSGVRQRSARPGSANAGSARPGELPETVVERVLWGTPHLHETFGGMRFRASAGAFLQVNPAQDDVLYGLALDAAQLREDDVVADLYCGVGTLTLMAARHVAAAVGVESVAPAIADARHNAQENRVTNARFLLGRTEDILRDKRLAVPRPTVVLLDPPRAGCGVEVARSIAVLRPRRVVYISCNPATLARDLRSLADEGYALESAVPVDMFPQTAHVECCSLLIRKDVTP